MKRLLATLIASVAITGVAQAAPAGPHGCHTPYGWITASKVTTCQFAAAAARQWLTLSEYRAQAVTHFTTWSATTDKTYPFTCRTTYSWAAIANRHWQVTCVAGPPAQGLVYVTFYSRVR